MSKTLCILLIALVVEAIGVVYLSKGMKQVGEIERIAVADILRAARKGITNPNVVVGVALEAAFFGALLYLLAHADVSLIWPLTSLGFVLTTAAARYINGEHVSALRWCGVLLIVMGAGLVSWSEKQKPPRSPGTPPENPPASRQPAVSGA